MRVPTDVQSCSDLQMGPESISGLAQAGCFPLKKLGCLPGPGGEVLGGCGLARKEGALDLGVSGTHLVPAASFPH